MQLTIDYGRSHLLDELYSSARSTLKATRCYDQKGACLSEMPQESWEICDFTTSYIQMDSSISTLGYLALESHMKRAKHKSHALHSQPPIAQFCTAAQPPNAPVSTSASNLTTVESHQHRLSQTSSPRTATAQGPSSGVIHVGGAPTLRAEVIWILKTISDHHSCSSNEGISKLFKAVFSD